MSNRPGVPHCSDSSSRSDGRGDWALCEDEVRSVEEGWYRTGGSLEFPIEQVMSPEVGLLMKPLSALVARTTRKGCGVA